MNNDQRYVAVNDAEIAYPVITQKRALAAARRLVRHFGRPHLASENVTWKMRLPTMARRCWASTKPTTGHHKGWGRLIHDISHRVFYYRHPGFKPHAGGHATLEREVQQYVVAKGWLGVSSESPSIHQTGEK